MIKPPSDRWAVTTLEHLVDILDSKRVPVKKTDRDKRPGNVPYYGATGQAGWIDEPIFNEELLLLGEDGAPFLDPTKPKSYIIRGPAWVNNHAHVLRAVDGLTSNEFLKYQLDWTPYAGHVTGTTRLKLTQRAMRQLPMLLPGKAEQSRIVAAIDEHFSRLDAVEATQRQIIRQIDILKSSLLAGAFRINGDLPPGWQQKTIGEVAQVQLGRQRSPQHHSGPQMRPYLRSANVTWEGICLDDVKQMNFDDADFETYKLEPGDLLLNEASGSPGEVGKPAIWNGEIEGCCFQNTLLRLRSAEVDIRYLYWHCYASALSGRFGDAGRGVNIRHLGKGGLAQFPIPVAPRDQQVQIAAQLDQHLEQTKRLERTANEVLNRVAALRQAVLSQAFSGRLVPQDPNDEPASALLGRIDASRRPT